MKTRNNFYTLIARAFKSEVRSVRASCRWFRISDSVSTTKNSGTNTSTIQRSYETVTSSKSIRQMPEDRVNSFLGKIRFRLASAWGARLHEYVDQRHKELGPVYRSSVGSTSAIFINSPAEYRKIFLELEGPSPKHFVPEAWIIYNKEHSKSLRGLFFMEGEEWLYFRKILNKLFLKVNSINFMIEPCGKVAKDLAKNLSPYAKTGAVVPNLKLQIYNYSLQAILATLIGSTWYTHKTEILKETDDLVAFLYKIFKYSSRLNVISATKAKEMNLSRWRQFAENLDNVLKKVKITVSLMTRLDGDGLLQKMMDSGINDQNLVRIVADLIIAAGDTTTSSTQWALYLLSTHPEIQERLYNSLKDKEHEEVHLDSLLKGVLKETLRLYPTAPFLTRYIPEDAQIGGYQVSKEELLLMSLYSSGRDPANFVQPDKFQPERWIRLEKGGYEGVIHPGATIPFAIGVRSCIGKKLAKVKINLAITEIVKNFRIECVNKRPVKMVLQMIAETSEPIQLKLIPR